ncbi:MAG: 3-hydroxyacyl-CoA dehydrogenase [Nitrososphaerota archaeon]
MFEKIAVVGAGTMGHGIAEVAALNGYVVFLCDISEEILREAIKKIEWSLRKMVEKGKLGNEELTLTLNRIRTTTSLEEAAKDSKLIIEAVPENLELKKGIFSRLDGMTHPETILGTNTSSLPISEIASVTSRPDKVIGIHFFNPPVIMPLVEIVCGDKTSKQTVDSVLTFIKTLGKQFIICRKDVPGFVVNRILEALIQEAAWIVHRGEASMLEVDSAVKYRAKLPMGLFELSDYVGIDVLYSAGKAIQDRDGGVIVSPLFEEYYKNGWYGKKSGKGFYTYTGDLWEKPKIPPELADKVNLEEIFAPAVNAAAWLLRNNVVDKEELDKAVILGLNFPEGILQMADKWGIDTLVQVLKIKRSKYGEYYKPDQLLEEMVANNRLGVKTRRGFYEYV